MTALPGQVLMYHMWDEGNAPKHFRRPFPRGEGIQEWIAVWPEAVAEMKQAGWIEIDARPHDSR